MTQITFKQFRSIDSVYNFDDVKSRVFNQDLEKGFDCLYRAANLAAQFPHLEFNFGCPWFIGQPPARMAATRAGKYYMSYLWHAWCEDEDFVYDSPDCLAEADHTINPDARVMLIPVPSKFYLPGTYLEGSDKAIDMYGKAVDAFVDWMKSRIKPLSNLKTPPDIVLFTGLALDDVVHVKTSQYNAGFHFLLGGEEFVDKVDRALTLSPEVVQVPEKSEDEFYAATGPNQ